MRKLHVFIILMLMLSLVFAACGDDDDDDQSTDDDATDDDVADDDVADDDVVVDPWDGVDIQAISAPDEYTVYVTLSGDPGAAEVEKPGIYSLDSDRGSLTVESVSYTANTRTIDISTGKQKLGIEYLLTIEPEGKEGEGLSAEFTAADNATFWAVDFSDPQYDQYQVTAYRAGVGEHCVVYIEEGMTAEDVEYTIAEFDNHIYPTETDLFIAAPDLDDNGKILILGLDGGEYYGGYFSQVNAYSDQETMDRWGLHSNEMEMVHINVVTETFYVTAVVPHEFQHLLYHERHGMGFEYWEYHDEGLAECAVHAVYGINSGALQYYLMDYYGLIGEGLSLVHWTWGLYDNYVQAYLFWTYLASKLDNVDTYGTIFDLQTGNPEEVDDFIAAELGSDFPAIQLRFMLANWIQADTGLHSYGEMLAWEPHVAPTAPSGTTSLDLEPFGGAFFALSSNSVNYPGTQGANIVYVGVNETDQVDTSEPFDVQNGVLLAFNTSQNYWTWTPEHSGPDVSAMARQKQAHEMLWISPAWTDPPPFNPNNLERLNAWRRATLDRITQGH